MDESGDLGFSLEKGSSRFFIVTAIFTDSKRRLEKIAKKTHATLRKKYRKVGVLHAYSETQATRQRLLKAVGKTDSNILVIILNKKKVYTKLKDEKAVLYNYVTNILLDRLLTKKIVPLNHEVHMIAAQRETNRFLNQNFKEYLANQASNTHKVKIKVEIATTAQEKALQVADFVSWAIFRKYEYNDDSYYNIIKEKIIEESLLYP